MYQSTDRHILIVEDDRWFADSTRRTLNAYGFTTAWAAEAQQAAEMVAERRPDLILLDIFLPNANGIQLLHELRGYDDSFDVPVIVCSTAAQDLRLENLESYGVLTLLNKATTTPASLIKAVKEVLYK